MEDIKSIKINRVYRELQDNYKGVLLRLYLIRKLLVRMILFYLLLRNVFGVKIVYFFGNGFFW